MARLEAPLSELAGVVVRTPQILRTVTVDDPARAVEAITSEVDLVAAEFGDDGRVLVRPSGTEPVVRVMVEAPELGAAERAAERLIAALSAVGRP
jgi:phosphoglucosamine mutase